MTDELPADQYKQRSAFTIDASKVEDARKQIIAANSSDRRDGEVDSDARTEKIFETIRKVGRTIR